MGVASGCGCKEVLDFLILLIPTPLVYMWVFYSSIPTFCSFFCFSFFVYSQLNNKLRVVVTDSTISAVYGFFN